MQHVRGDYVIFADADGASKFDDLEKLEKELKMIERENLGIAVGSRAHLVHSPAVVQVRFITHSPSMGDADGLVALLYPKFHDVWVPYFFALYWYSCDQRHTMWIQVVYATSLCFDIPVDAC